MIVRFLSQCAVLLVLVTIRCSTRDLTPTIKELNAIFDEDLANFKQASSRRDLIITVNDTISWQEVLFPYMFDVELKIGNCSLEGAFQNLDRSGDVEIYGGDVAVVRTGLTTSSAISCRSSKFELDHRPTPTPIAGHLSLTLDLSFSYIKFGDHLMHRPYVKPMLNRNESNDQIYEIEPFGKRINDSLKKALLTVDGQDKLFDSITRGLINYDWSKMQQGFHYTQILVDRLITSQ